MRSLNRLKFKFLVETSVRRIVDEEFEIRGRQLNVGCVHSDNVWV